MGITSAHIAFPNDPYGWIDQASLPGIHDPDARGGKISLVPRRKDRFMP
jgi:hypothetical protein